MLDVMEPDTQGIQHLQVPKTEQYRPNDNKDFHINLLNDLLPHSIYHHLTLVKLRTSDLKTPRPA